MISAAIQKAIHNGLQSAIPETALTVSKWAEKFRVVSAERVADPGLAGFWRNERTPYLVDIMDAVNDPTINEIVFVKSAQVGGTEFINNVIGYFIHIDPATILYICETDLKATAWSIESFAPMIRDTPALANIFGIAKTREATNRIESKAFAGGHFALAWATSPATLSSRPVRILLRDETDAYESTKEGDPLDLSEARTKTAGTQRKVIDVSTPRNADPTDNLSQIERRYNNSTAEKYFVPCPNCDEFQFLKWANVIWEENPELAYYACEHCGEIIEESEKLEIISRGEWRSTNPEYSGNRRGFWINELYSPFTTWGQMALAFLEAKNQPEKLKTFTNTRLAESWKIDGEKIDYADLKFNREDYSAEIPDGVIFLTAAVDVQGDRLECEVLGWGLDYENWSIDYRVFHGDPTDKDVWKELKEYLLKEWTNADEDIFKIKTTCIDSGGHHTQEVYKFCKDNARYKFFAIKGANTAGQPIVSPPTRNNTLRVKLFKVGTEAAKDMFFGWLKKQISEDEEIDTSGFCHFPSDREDYYFKMLCAEKRITKMVRGRATSYWVKVSENARNEALDVRVYNIAAMHILYPSKKSYPKTYLAKSRKLAKDNLAEKELDETKIEPKPQLKQSARKGGFATNGIRRGSGGFAKRW